MLNKVKARLEKIVKCNIVEREREREREQNNNNNKKKKHNTVNCLHTIYKSRISNL